MAHVLYIPSYSEHVAITRLRIVGKDIPFYWREPEAAHDMASRHYPGGRVYAVSVGPDWRLMAREHAMGDPAPAAEASSGIVEAVGSAAAVLFLIIGGAYAVGWGTLL